jgi:hypothetical protein
MPLQKIMNNNNKRIVIREVMAAVIMKGTRDVPPRKAYSSTLKPGTVHSSETSVKFYQTARRYMPKAQTN